MDRQTDGQTDGQAQTNMPPQLLRSWGHKNMDTYTPYCKTLIFGGYIILAILGVKAKSAKNICLPILNADLN